MPGHVRRVAQEVLEEAPLALADGRAERARLLVGHVEGDVLRLRDRRGGRAGGRVRVDARPACSCCRSRSRPSRPTPVAAAGVARNFTNAWIAGVSLKATIVSPPITTDGRRAVDRRERELAVVGSGLRLHGRDAGDEVALHHDRRLRRVLEDVVDRGREVRLDGARRAAGEVRRVAEHLGHRLQRRGDRRVGPLDLVRREQRRTSPAPAWRR